MLYDFPGYSTDLIDDFEVESSQLLAQDVFNGLLQHNYFPNHSRDKEELPPIFSSNSFSLEVAKKLSESTPNRPSGYQGYDTVEYKLTRYSGVPRNCSIPHPRAYAILAQCILENWEHLRYVLDNEVSLTHPEFHKDGRIAIMNYEEKMDERRRELIASFGRRFKVKTDISNFYPSIYSHSISWATVGFATSKANKNGSEWFNKLDKAVRNSNRGETNGIAIGPGTSSILSELILARVDSKLGDEFADRISFTRYIDDYTAYCDSHDLAEEFVHKLSEELSKYRLNINVAKTEITSLPEPDDDNWVIELNNNLATIEIGSSHSTAGFLDLAVSLAGNIPDGSVLKYALKCIIKKIERAKGLNQGDIEISDTLMEYTFNLAFHQPALAPLLGRLLHASDCFYVDGWHSRFQKILCEYTRKGNTDGITWMLFYCLTYNVPIKECCAATILESQDCIPILLLYWLSDSDYQSRVLDFVKQLDKTDLYLLDQYWLLLYQLYCEGKIDNPYETDDCFELMKSEGVNFVDFPLGKATWNSVDSESLPF